MTPYEVLAPLNFAAVSLKVDAKGTVFGIVLEPSVLFVFECKSATDELTALPAASIPFLFLVTPNPDPDLKRNSFQTPENIINVCHTVLSKLMSTGILPT